MRKFICAFFVLLCIGGGMAEAQDKPAIFPQLGHSISVLSVAYSPDGKLVASAGDATVKLWDVASGRELRSLAGHSNRVASVAFSPDGKFLVSGAGDKLIKLWDVATGRELRTLKGHQEMVLAAAFSPDGKLVASSDLAGIAALWDAASGRVLRGFKGHTGPIASLAFSPDGKMLATGGGHPFGISDDHTIRLWDVASGRALRTMPGHDGAVTRVAFAAGGRVLASAGEDKLVKLWDVADGHELRRLNGHTDKVFGLAVTPDGATLVSAGFDKTIRFWDVASGRELRSLTDQARVEAIALSPDGQRLVSGGTDMAVKLWDVASGQKLRSMGGSADWLWSAALSPDGRSLAAGGWHGAVTQWDLQTGRATRTLKGHGDNWVRSIAFSPDGTVLASGGLDKTIKLWDAASGQELHTLSGHTDGIWSLSFSPDGKTLASAGYDGTVKLWTVASGAALRSLGGNSGAVFAVAFSPDGRLIASASDELTFWDAATGRRLNSYKVPGGFTSLAFAPDGRSVAAGDGAGAITLWDVANRRVLRKIRGHISMVTSLAFTPDGQSLASASEDKAVKLWNVATGRERRTLGAHVDWVWAVAVSADGRIAASAGGDGAVKLWDIASGRERLSLIAFVDGSSLAITPEGYFDSSSAAAEEALNVRVGNRVFGIGNYREQFYRPELVRLKLAGGNLDGFAALDSVKLAPIVEIVDLPRNTDQPKVTVKLRIADGGGGIGPVRVFLNGTAILQDDEKPPGNAGTRSYTIPVVQGRNTIGALAFNATGSMESNRATGVIEADIPDPGTLHALVIGIQDFKNPEFKLNYSVADAKLFADTLRQYSAPLFKAVDIKLLTTPAETDKAHLVAALKAMRATVSPDDLFVFYIASHGVVGDGTYFLVTADVDSFDAGKLAAQALGSKELASLLMNIPVPKKLVIFDTCQSEAMADAVQWARLNRGMDDKAAATILSRSTGMAVFAAAKTDQGALEGYKEHGLFTYFVADGLAGAADLGKLGTVNTDGLTYYVRSVVPKLASGLGYQQHPIAEPSGEEFEVTKVR